MRRNLNGMIVLITGASAGIGRTLAEQLSRQGARLALAARRLDRLEDLNQTLGGQHLALRADVANPDDCRMIVDRTIQHFGRLDTLVCNAGYGIYKLVSETTADDMRDMFNTDVIGTTECIRFTIPHMLTQSPRDGFRAQIMIVSSAAARRGTPYIGAYSGAKAAQLAIAEALRAELSPHQIAVTSIHPIMTKTEFRHAAESLGNYKLPPSPSWVPSQSADYVAKKMVDAITCPRPEVWPHSPSRYLLGLGTLFPSLMNRLMSNYRGDVEKFNTPT